MVNKVESTVRKRTVKVKVINIALYPDSKQEPENYTRILREIYNTKYQTATYRDHCMRLMSMNEEDGVIYGKMANFTQIDPDKPSLDLRTNDEVEIGVDSHYGRNLKKWDYFFIPEVHRFVYIASQCSDSQVKKFLESAFEANKEEGESVEISIEKTASVIEDILSARGLSRLYVRTSFSNNDNYNGWAKAIDDQYRAGNVRSAIVEVKAAKGEPIKIDKSEMLQAYVRMSQSYGYAEASVLGENGKVSNINTEKHPLVKEVLFTDNLATKIKELILNIFKPKS